jgi:RNA polymerase subunit RPABC4/transcription elongation factor Spt4
MSEKLISCKVCGKEIAKSAKSCPHCGKRNKQPVWKLILIIIGVCVAISIAVNTMSVDYATAELKKIENQVAKDAEESYRIAKESGNAMDTYIQAGLVAAIYLQAQDSENYKKWKEIEKTEAKSIGLDF